MQEGWVCPCNIYFNGHVIDVMRVVWGTLSYKVWFWKVIREGESLIPKCLPSLPWRYFLFLTAFPNLYSVPPTNCHSVPLGCVVLTADLSCPHHSTSAYNFHPIPSHSFSTHFQSQWYQTVSSSRPIPPSSSNLFNLFHSLFSAWNAFFHHFVHCALFVPQEPKHHFLRSLLQLLQAEFIFCLCVLTALWISLSYNVGYAVIMFFFLYLS